MKGGCPIDLPNVILSNKYLESYPAIPFGVGTVWGCIPKRIREAVATKRTLYEKAMKERSEEIEIQIRAYNSFFKKKGYKCPLPNQFRTAVQRGIPHIMPYVDVLLLCELGNGVLMGIQDLDAVIGNLTLDVTSKGEQFPGFRGLVTCRDNEIVLRDEKGIIASYFQGPDKRTEVTKTSRNILLYGFFAQNIKSAVVEHALQQAVELLSNTGKETSKVRIFGNYK